MGVVYRGVDTRLNRPVAIKTVDEQFTDRFDSEARAISALNHPHVCTLYDVGPGYLVMELLEGDTLASRLQRGALPVAAVLRYGAQIAAALAAAHAKNIVHRDLKPGNVMLTTGGAKVLDFGIAKSSGDNAATATATGGVIGTAAYMSPEQLAGAPVDSRSDIYSLGLVLFEMVTGSRLVREQEPGPSLSAAPERLAHVIEGCLAQAPDERWQSATDIRRELEWAARATQRTANASAPLGGYRMAAIAGVAVIAMALVGARYIGVLPRPAAPKPAIPSRTSITLPAGTRLDSSAPLAISPDGSVIAFVARNETGDRNLYLRSLASDTVTELKGTTGANHPFFSPDGRTIGFFTADTLHRVSLDGSAPVPVCPLPGIEHGGAWGPDDTIVVALRGRGLFKVSAAGGELKLIADGIYGAWPSFLPDGRTLLYSSFAEKAGRTVGIAAIGVDGSGRRDVARLSDETGDGAKVLGTAAEIQQAVMLPQGYLVFGQDPGFVRALRIDETTLAPRGAVITLGESVERGPGSGGVAFAVARGGLLVFAPTGNNHQLVWVTRQGTVTPLSVEPAAYREPALSPDEHTIAVSANDESRRPNLWVIDVNRGTRSMLASEALAPEWTPDGRYIVHNGATALMRTAPDGRGSETLATPDEIRKRIPPGTGPYTTGFSPDGRYFLFQANNDDLWRVKYPETIFEPVFIGPTAEWGGTISRDGRLLAFVSNRSGRNEIDVARWPGLEQRTVVSSRGGVLPHWSKTSNEVFFWQQRTLMAARIGPAMDVEAPRPLFSGDFVGAGRDASFDVASDGRFLMVKSDPRSQLTQISVVQNWIQ
jgi:Tol biopolymer transport system component